MWSWPWYPLRNLFGASSLGQRGEQLAARHLRGLGYRILARGYRTHLGELDVIAADGETIVFVEVKTRQSTQHGLPAEAVNAEKQRRLTRAGLGYLKRRGWLARPSRFDVISIVWSDLNQPPELTHFLHAFEATDRGQLYS